MKYFGAVELFTLLADRNWLDDVTKTISAYWRRRNERRKSSVEGALRRHETRLGNFDSSALDSN